MNTIHTATGSDNASINAAIDARTKVERYNDETRARLQILRKQLDAALETVTKLPGNKALTFKLGNCTFGSEGVFTFKLEGVLPGGTNREEQEYAHLVKIEAQGRMIPGPDLQTDKKTGLQFRPYVNTPGRRLPPLGTEFTYQGETYKIVGATKRGRILADSAAGKRYTMSVDAVVNVTSGK